MITSVVDDYWTIWLHNDDDGNELSGRRLRDTMTAHWWWWWWTQWSTTTGHYDCTIMMMVMNSVVDDYGTLWLHNNDDGDELSRRRLRDTMTAQWWWWWLTQWSITTEHYDCTMIMMVMNSVFDNLGANSRYPVCGEMLCRMRHTHVLVWRVGFYTNSFHGTYDETI